jgi:glycosyltransferase involved in cell wall biosynthesis
MPRLLLITPAELTRDPRARRAAMTAKQLGYDVVGLSGRISGEQPVPLADVKVVRVGRDGTPSTTWTLGEGRREHALVRELRGLFRLLRMARRSVALFRAGRSLERTDVVHANDLDTLPAAYVLARRTSSRLVYDAHELYKEFEPNPPRLARFVLGGLERALARRSDAVVTVSDPLAAELSTRLGVQPIVVLNAPPVSRRGTPEPPPIPPLRVIYQGALGPARPLDDLIAAMSFAPSAVLSLRINRSVVAAIERAIPDDLHARVQVLDPVDPSDVFDGLSGHHVGVLFDRPLTRNAELSSPNKLFEYLMAGLAVVAPSVDGLAFIEAEGVGLTYTPGSSAALGAALERLASDPRLVLRLRTRARDLASQRFNAEAQQSALALAWGGRVGAVPG